MSCPRIGICLDTQQHLSYLPVTATSAKTSGQLQTDQLQPGPTSILLFQIKGLDIRIPDGHRLSVEVRLPPAYLNAAASRADSPKSCFPQGYFPKGCIPQRSLPRGGCSPTTL